MAFKRRRTKAKTKAVSKAVKTYVSRKLDNLVEDKITNVRLQAVAGTAVTANAGSITPIVLLSQGSGATARIGNVIRPKSLRFAIAFGTAAVGAVIRYILFYDKTNQGVVPIVADVLETPTATAEPISGYANLLQSNDSFKVILDRTIRIDAASQLLYVKTHMLRKSRLPSKIGFVGTAATQVSLGTNSLYCLMISNQPLAAPSPSVIFDAQMVYEDA